MRKDFAKQWEQRRRAAAEARCPLSEQTIEAMESKAMSMPVVSAMPIGQRHFPYRIIIAAAIALTVLVISLHGIAQPTVRQATLNNQTVRFLSNHSCTAETVAQSLDRMICKP